MPRGWCAKHGREHPCTCAMGKVYRFIEPVLLLMLREKGHSYGYDLSEGLRAYALTDAEIERAALYRTLRTLEHNGYVRSAWTLRNGGPARRVYVLTKAGRRHLEEWSEVMGRLSGAMRKFVTRANAHGANA